MDGTSEGHIYSTDQYQYQGRIIEAEGFRTPQRWRYDILTADQSPFKLHIDPAVSWLGCRGDMDS
jgi:hypothetical protein